MRQIWTITMPSARSSTAKLLRSDDVGSSSFDDSHQYPVGKKVLVHYNPSNPAQAVLRTWHSRRHVVFLRARNGVHFDLWHSFEIYGTVANLRLKTALINAIPGL